jgi:hypothetical protein
MGVPGAAMDTGDFAEFVICTLRQMLGDEVIIAQKKLMTGSQQ